MDSNDKGMGLTWLYEELCDLWTDFTKVSHLKNLSQFAMQSVWPDGYGVCLIFGPLEHWKHDQEHRFFAKVDLKVCLI